MATNEQISKAITDSESAASNEGLKGLEKSVADNRESIEQSKEALAILKSINDKQEELNKKIKLSKADKEEINNLLALQYVKENETNKVLIGREPLNVRNKKDLAKVLDMSKQLQSVHSASIRIANEGIKSQTAQLKTIRERQKSEATGRREETKANEARVKAEQQVTDLQKKRSGYKPTSELFKMASERQVAIDNYKATHGGKTPEGFSGSGQKALMYSGMAADAAQGIGGGALRIASGGLSGLGGAASGVASMIGGLARVGGGAAGGAIAGAFTGGAAAPIGAAIGTMLGSAVEPILQAGIQAQILLKERGIRGSIFNASLNRMNNFSGGLTSSNRVGVDRQDMSYGEVEGVRDSAASIGSDLSDTNSNNYDEFVQLAATKKLYGETGIKVTRELAYATNDYEGALTGVNKIMASSIQGAKNMNISQDAVATAMANAGKQARFAGTDAMEAMRLYHSISADKGRLESLKGANIDFSAEGGALIGNMSNMGSRMNLASQVYMAANQGETDPLLAMFKMQYGNVDASMKDGKFSLGAPKPGEGFFGAKAVHQDLTGRLKEFTEANGGDARKGMAMLQMYAQQAHPGLSKKDVDMITQINPNDSKDWEKVAAAIEKPDTVLKQLQNMDSINQNISNKMAAILDNVPFIKSIFDFLTGNETKAPTAVEESKYFYDKRIVTPEVAKKEAARSKEITDTMPPAVAKKILEVQRDQDILKYPSREQVRQNGMVPGGPLAPSVKWSIDSAGDVSLSGQVTLTVPKAAMDAQRRV